MMKTRDVAVVACKGLAIYALICGLDALAQTGWAFVWPSSVPARQGLARFQELLIAIVLPVGSVVGVAVLLWVFARNVAGWMVPKRPPEAEPAQCVPDRFAGQLRTILLAAIGCYLLVSAGPPLLSTVLGLLLQVVCPGVQWGEVFGGISFQTVDLLKVGLGLWLLLGARGLARAVEWLRTVGRRPSAQDIPGGNNEGTDG
jgi:hypothetical protein